MKITRAMIWAVVRELEEIIKRAQDDEPDFPPLWELERIAERCLESALDEVDWNDVIG